jgi:hypothetical protein
MGARPVVLVSLVSLGCVMINPAFDEPVETQGSPETGDGDGDGDEHSVETGDGDGGEESGLVCELGGGLDLHVDVPQHCGINNDPLDAYHHWFKVVAAQGSTWSVQFCLAPGCAEEDCKTDVTSPLTISPLPLAELAGAGDCLEFTARRLDENDECNYHAITVRRVDIAGDHVVLLARRTEQLELPPVPSATGLHDFNPELLEVESCSCSEFPGSCCGSHQATLHAYGVDNHVIPVGAQQDLSILGREYTFWAFDAFSPGDCGGTTNIAWALTAR